VWCYAGAWPGGALGEKGSVQIAREFSRTATNSSMVSAHWDQEHLFFFFLQVSANSESTSMLRHHSMTPEPAIRAPNQPVHRLWQDSSMRCFFCLPCRQDSIASRGDKGGNRGADGGVAGNIRRPCNAPQMPGPPLVLLPWGRRCPCEVWEHKAAVAGARRQEGQARGVVPHACHRVCTPQKWAPSREQPGLNGTCSPVRCALSS